MALAEPHVKTLGESKELIKAKLFSLKEEDFSD